MNTELQSKHLIFLISQPRAGSTLLQTILENHPKIQTTSEPWTMLHSVYALRDRGYETEYNATWAKSALKDFLQMLPDGEEAYIEGLRRMHTYLYECALTQSGKDYFLDKTPRYYHIIPELYRIFPEAKFIILLRNPLAVMCSIVSTWIQKDWFELKQYQHDLIKAPQLLLKGIEGLGKQNCLVLHYESLLKNPEQEIEKICDKLNIDFLPEMISYRHDNSPKLGFGYKDQKRDVYLTGKPKPENLDKWLSATKEPQLWRVVDDYLEFLGQETVSQMGYSYKQLRQQLNARRPQSFYLWRTFPLLQLFSKPQGYQWWKYHLLRLGSSIRQLGSEQSSFSIAKIYRRITKISSNSNNLKGFFHNFF